MQNCNRGGAVRLSPYRTRHAGQCDWLAHRYRLAIREFISANGIVRTATAARCQYPPARSAAAAHSSDVATPTELSRALVGDAIEQVNLSIDGREEPQRVFFPRDGRSRIKWRRRGLLSNTRSKSAG